MGTAHPHRDIPGIYLLSTKEPNASIPILIGAENWENLIAGTHLIGGSLKANKRTGISSASVHRLQTSWNSICYLWLSRETTSGCAAARSLLPSRHHVSLLLLQHRPDKQARPRPARHFLRQPTLRPFERRRRQDEQISACLAIRIDTHGLAKLVANPGSGSGQGQVGFLYSRWRRRAPRLSA